MNFSYKARSRVKIIPKVIYRLGGRSLSFDRKKFFQGGLRGRFFSAPSNDDPRHWSKILSEWVFVTIICPSVELTWIPKYTDTFWQLHSNKKSRQLRNWVTTICPRDVLTWVPRKIINFFFWKLKHWNSIAPPHFGRIEGAAGQRWCAALLLASLPLVFCPRYAKIRM